MHILYNRHSTISHFWESSSSILSRQGHLPSIWLSTYRYGSVISLYSSGNFIRTVVSFVQCGSLIPFPFFTSSSAFPMVLSLLFPPFQLLFFCLSFFVPLDIFIMPLFVCHVSWYCFRLTSGWIPGPSLHLRQFLV